MATRYGALLGHVPLIYDIYFDPCDIAVSLIYFLSHHISFA